MEEEAYFHKKRQNGWWIEIPFISNGNKTKRNNLLPCSYDEYLGACNQNFPRDGGKHNEKQYLKDDFNTTILIL
jgi:hypothetical protein